MPEKRKAEKLPSERGRIIRDFQLSKETFKITDRKDFKRNYLE